MEKLFEGIGSALVAMPPAYAAVVIIALAALGLAYAWRRAGEEAKREKANAQDARDANTGANMRHLIDGQNEVLSGVERIERALAVLMDRGKR